DVKLWFVVAGFGGRIDQELTVGRDRGPFQVRGSIGQARELVDMQAGGRLDAAGEQQGSRNQKSEAEGESSEDAEGDTEGGVRGCGSRGRSRNRLRRLVMTVLVKDGNVRTLGYFDADGLGATFGFVILEEFEAEAAGLDSDDGIGFRVEVLR